MAEPTRLERMVRQFHHRWETSPQYRATVTAVLGAAMIISICASGTLVAMAANSALGGLGITSASGAYSSSLSTGTQKLRAIEKFPTPTFTNNTQTAPPPVSTIPSSQTPMPGQTPTPSPTIGLATTPTAGGGGGQMPTTCNGGGGGGTWQIAPCPLVHGQGGSLTIVDTAYPGASVNVVLSFGVCSGNSSCSDVYSPAGGYALNGNGALTISFTVPANAQPGAAPVSGMINISGGPTMGIAAAPVQ